MICPDCGERPRYAFVQPEPKVFKSTDPIDFTCACGTTRSAREETSR